MIRCKAVSDHLVCILTNENLDLGMQKLGHIKTSIFHSLLANYWKTPFCNFKHILKSLPAFSEDHDGLK